MSWTLNGEDLDMWRWRNGQERLVEYSWMRGLVDQKNCARRTYGALKKLLQFGQLLGSSVMHGQEGPLWLDWSTLFFFFLILFIYFIYGCVGSSFLCEGFL